MGLKIGGEAGLLAGNARKLEECLPHCWVAKEWRKLEECLPHCWVAKEWILGVMVTTMQGQGH